MRLIIPAFLFAISACGPADKKAVNSLAPIRVTDFRNKEITLEKPATRVVCLIESALSGFYMLQAEDLIVGVPSAVYNESPAPFYSVMDDRIRTRSLPAPGNWDFVSIENVVALQPDLVIMWASQTESIRSVEQHEIPVYAVFLKSFDDVYKEIKDLGTLTGRSQRADTLIEYSRNMVEKIRSRTEFLQGDRRSVYFMWAQGLLQTAGTESTVNELIELAGARNSCTLPQEQIIVNLERLLEWNPDVVVMWYNSAKDPADILTLPEIRSINAIKNREVYEITSVFMYDLWTLKFPNAVMMVAAWCYPSLFEDFDMDAEKEIMLTSLYGTKGQSLLHE
jgi:iron complex transport system substrate-binding protein